jgi:hypothetical protein
MLEKEEPAGRRRSRRALWQRAYWDRNLHDARHHTVVIHYIRNNLGRAGLV